MPNLPYKELDSTRAASRRRGPLSEGAQSPSLSARDNPSETDASVLDAATAVGLVLVGLMSLYAMSGYVNGVIQSQMELLANLIERVCEVYDLLLEVRDLAWRILSVVYTS